MGALVENLESMILDGIPCAFSFDETGNEVISWNLIVFRELLELKMAVFGISTGLKMKV